MLRIDGEVVVDNTEPVRGTGFYGAGSEPIETDCELVGGHAYSTRSTCGHGRAPRPSWVRGSATGRPDAGDEFERAVLAAAAADVAVVVVGSNGQWESEGHDRPDLALPGRQRELVEAVIDANPRTVVVVNAGSPVELPWAERAAAVLLSWYAGEEGADALAEIVVGAREPTGRLPITFPVRAPDGPTSGATRYPGTGGKVTYGEGVFVGYRHFETAGVAPQFAFGHGLSYGNVHFDEVGVTGARVTVRLVNKGNRRGTEVVQVYVRALEPRSRGRTGSWWGSRKWQWRPASRRRSRWS